MRLSLTIIVMAFGCLEVEAAEFHLRDGSIIVGSIVNLVDGEDLVVDTAYMDEVTIEWDAIEEIRGTQAVDVVTFDNRRFVGTVEVDESNLRISGEDNVQVAPEDVFSIDEVSETFWDGIDAYTDLGMNVVRGNNQVTQLNFGAGLSYDGRDFETSVDASQIINEQLEAGDTRRTTLAASYSHTLTARWQAAGLYQFESDEQQGLDGRSLLAGYIGNRLINNRRQRFEIYGGAAINSERFEGLSRSESLEGLLGFAYRLRWIADVDMSLTFFPNLEQGDRLRSQFDGTLSFDLLSQLDFKATVFNRYDSAPPAGNEKTDTGITLGLSWEY